MKSQSSFSLMRSILFTFLFLLTGGLGAQKDAGPFSVAPTYVKAPPELTGTSFDHKVPLRKFGVEEGLTHSNIRAVLVDDRGYLWVGTDGGGVFRYDGREMEQFDASDGLAGQRVFDIFQARDGSIWIGTLLGVSRFDGKHFRSFVPPGKCAEVKGEHCSERLSNRVIYDISQDEEGHIWLASAGGGMMQYEGDSWTYFVPKGQCPPDSTLTGDCIDQLPAQVGRTVIEGPEGKIWMGTFKGGMLSYDGDSFVYYGNRKGCKKYADRYQDTVFLDVGSNVFWASMLDRKGRLWFGTPQGIHRKGKDGWLQLRGRCAERKGACKAVGIWNPLINAFEESKGPSYWFGTYRGAGRIEKDSVTHKITVKEGLSDQMVEDLDQGLHGTVWMGTNNGLDQSLSNAIEIFDEQSGLSIEQVTTLYTDDRGRVWIGSNDGDGALDRLTPEDSLLHLMPRENMGQEGIDALEAGSGNSVWIATNGGGIYRYGPDRLLHYSERFDSQLDTCMGSDKIVALHKQKDGVLWAGGERGVTRFGPDTSRLFTMEDGLNHPNIHVISEDAEGRVWIGAPLRGLNIYQNGEFLSIRKEPTGMRSEQIRDLVFGPDQDLWVATYGGGIHYLKDPEKVQSPEDVDWRFITEKEGLPSNAVTGLHFDDRGRLWVATDLGAAQVDPEEHDVVRTLEGPDGFLGVQCTGAITSDREGRVLFGTSDHLIRYDPDQARQWDQAPPLYIEEVAIDHQGTDWKKERDSLQQELGLSYELSPENGFPEGLTLPHDRARLIFRFQAINLRAPSGVKYRYRLKGLGSDWSPWQKQQRAIYNDLKPGRYTFQVEAKDRKGRKSEKRQSFSFRVKPPWWQTVWFRSSSAAGLLLLIIIFFRWRTATIRKRKAELEEKVEERTQELAAKNQEITDSIDYASAIQHALLPSDESLQRSFPDHFVLYKPRDPVSGDFYWCYAPSGTELLWMVADCTGHGVPGAFMSMMGNNLLDEVIVKEGERDPGRILDRLREGIVEKIGGERRKDGMDAALCHWDRSSGVLRFAGANNPLFLIRQGVGEAPEQIFPDLPAERLRPFKNSSDGIEIKGDRQAVALGEKEGKAPDPFTSLQIPLQEGDRLYTFTDGLPDQFGGPRDKKFGYRRFKEELLAHSGLSMQEQRETLEKALEEWKGQREQIDDICIMGVHIDNPAPAAGS